MNRSALWMNEARRMYRRKTGVDWLTWYRKRLVGMTYLTAEESCLYCCFMAAACADVPA